MLRLLLLLVLQIQCIWANTEKVVFLAPESLQIPVEHPTLEDLRLEALLPRQLSLRTHVEAEFPTNASKYGKESWYLLHSLQEGQRYEVRICWAATQPTSFRLETYDLATVFATPDLITSLAAYSESRHPDSIDAENQKRSITETKSEYAPESISSTLFLQIQTAADFYTMNQSMMQNPPPIFVDIILDPYLFNVFPKSLLPTGMYIFVLAIGGWFLAKYVSTLMLSVAQTGEDAKKKQ